MAFQTPPLKSSLELYSNLYNGQQIRELDHLAISNGIPGIRLMKRAGQAILNEVLEQEPRPRNIQVFCGSGNNGGDGYIVAGLAKQKNIDVRLVETAGKKLQGDALLARNFALAQGVDPVGASEWLQTAEFFDPEPLDDAVIVDALLGTGFSGSLREPYTKLIRQINQSNLPIISADIPSGLCADTGAVADQAVQANTTVTFIGLKIGLFTGQGRACSGDIIFDDLLEALQAPNTIYEQVQPLAAMLDYDLLYESLPERQLSNHKGSHGHVVVAGGDLGFGGAPLMAAVAAARTGAGLVSIITRSEHQAAIIARYPEIMACDAANALRVESVLSKATVIVVGPGLNTQAWGQKLLQSVFAAKKPMIVDADALNLLATGQFKSWLPLKTSVITPHPGEASRLLNLTTQEINQDRISAVEQLQKQFASVALLKGSGSLINDGDHLTLCPYGNPGMGSGGMGDVLSGIIGSLMAQGMSPDQAAKLGVCVHAYAADCLAEESGERGLMAMDLIDEVRRLINGI